MLIQILFALLAGILTVAAPCILPMLPILLGASVGQQSKQRPLLIVAGFVVSFAAASLVLSAIVSHLGLSANTIRGAAIIILGIFAVFLIWPKPFELLTLKLSGAINKASQVGRGRGNMSGLILGLVLGIVWTPCAGPVLGSILTLIATQGTGLKSVLLIIAYAFGAGVPMLIIAYGSQYITMKVRWLTQYSLRLQQIFGVLILALAAAMYFNYDTKIELALTQAFPQSTLEHQLVENLQSSPSADNQISNAAKPISVMQKIQFQNYGQAPEFAGISNWLNSNPLTMQKLRGKVVLVDFWTYSCINCIRTLPYVTKWYNNYKDQGLVVVGVHTPEFAFEKETNNVAEAIKNFEINYPVAQDNDYKTWSAFNNIYWPAEYLIDQNGKIVYEHFGEGEYDRTENAIKQLLGMNADVAPDNGMDLSGIGSPEMYFEPARLQNLTPDQAASNQPTQYTFTQNLQLNNFALSGEWKFTQDHAELVSGPGAVLLRYRAKNVFMVASSKQPTTVTVRLDGDKANEVTIQASQLYQLIKSDVSGEHTIEIEIPDSGFKAFTFTFG